MNQIRQILITILFVCCFGNQAFAQWTQSQSLTGGSIVTDMIAYNGYLYSNLDGCGVYRSADQGDTWTKTAMPQQFNFVYLIQHNTELLAFSYGKLFRTTDGNIWNEAGGPEEFINDVSSDGVNIFVATTNGIFKSTNSGVTWTKNTNSLTQINIASIAVKGSSVWAGAAYPTPGTLLKSEDGGTTWSPVVIGTNKVSDIFFEGTNLYINVDYSGIYKSINNGINWQLVRPAILEGKLFVTPSALFFITNNKLSISLNGGTSWSEKNNTTPGFFAQDLYVTGTHVFVGCWGGGVFRSDITGSQPWTAVNSGLNCVDINAIEIVNNTILLGTEFSFIRSSSDDGDAWEQKLDNYNSPASSARNVLSIGADLFVTTQSGGGLYRSSDNGSSWQQINEGLGTIIINSLAATSTGIIIGTDNGVFISTNRGNTWTNKSSGITGGVRSIYTDGPVLYVGTWSGLYQSDTNGDFWSKISTGLPDESIGQITSIGSILFAATQFNGLYKTSNGGTTWESVNSNFVQKLATRNNDLFMSSQSKKLFHSSDSGETWTDISVGLPDAIISAIHFTNTKLVAGIYKSGVWLKALTEIIPPRFTFHSSIPGSLFLIGEPILVTSDQELRKSDGSILESVNLEDYIQVNDSEGIAVEFIAELSVDKKVITLTIINPEEEEDYTITLDPFANESGLNSLTTTSVAFTAVVNVPPILNEHISVSGEGNALLSFSESIFVNAFTDEESDPLEKIVIKSLPLHGALLLNNNAVTVGTEIAREFIGQLTYAPQSGFVGTDQWTWNGSDGKNYAAVDSKVTVEIMAITAIAEGSSTKLYPNPISTILNIEFSYHSSEGYSIHVFDLTGREIKNISIREGGKGFITELDFSEIDNGIYILSIIHSGKHFQQKVIKL